MCTSKDDMNLDIVVMDDMNLYIVLWASDSCGHWYPCLFRCLFDPLSGHGRPVPANIMQRWHRTASVSLSTVFLLYLLHVFSRRVTSIVYEYAFKVKIMPRIIYTSVFVHTPACWSIGMAPNPLHVEIILLLTTFGNQLLRPCPKWTTSPSKTYAC